MTKPYDDVEGQGSDGGATRSFLAPATSNFTSQQQDEIASMIESGINSADLPLTRTMRDEVRRIVADAIHAAKSGCGCSVDKPNNDKCDSCAFTFLDKDSNVEAFGEVAREIIERSLPWLSSKEKAEGRL